MSVTLLLSLREGVTAERSGLAGIVFEGHGVRLSIRPDDPSLVEPLLRLAPPGWDEDHLADETPDAIQVLLIVSARLPRLSWKYASIAYALVLKHVGVVFHSMHLAATAMGLAACALGAGDSDLFARAAGTDYDTETSVGEFLLGSRRVANSPPR